MPEFWKFVSSFLESSASNYNECTDDEWNDFEDWIETYKALELLSDDFDYEWESEFYDSDGEWLGCGLPFFEETAKTNVGLWYQSLLWPVISTNIYYMVFQVIRGKESWLDNFVPWVIAKYVSNMTFLVWAGTSIGYLW